MGVHTYINCTRCGYEVRASRHHPDECEGWRKFGKPDMCTRDFIKNHMTRRCSKELGHDGVCG